MTAPEPSSFALRRCYAHIRSAPTRERMVRLHAELGYEPTVQDVLADIRRERAAAPKWSMFTPTRRATS